MVTSIIVSYDGTYAWIVSDLTSVIGFNLTSLTPTSIALANGATAYNGSISMDGHLVYVGGSDNQVHALNTSTLTDAAQIAVGLKDVNSNTVPPNLVVVLPH